MLVTRSLGLMVLLTALAAGSQAAMKSDGERCREHAGLDACYDAIRRDPRDPVLLIALGDTLQRTNRPAEAVRAYRRAVALSPNIPGVGAKIHAAEARAAGKPVAGKPVAGKPVAGKSAAGKPVAAKLVAAKPAAAKSAPAQPTVATTIAANPVVTVAALQPVPGRRFSNADPVAQSH